MTLSVIIPVWEDAAALRVCLERLRGADPPVEFVIAAACADENCRRLASEAGARLVECAHPNRGAQLNAGAAASSGSVLIFLHADTELLPGHLSNVAAAFSRTEVEAATFYKDLRTHYPAFAWTDPIVRSWLRCCGVIYGDQCFILRRSLFERLGGFANLPIMEDIELSQRLRRAVPRRALAFLDPPLRCSMRRFSDRGKLRTRLQNIGLVWLWRLRLLTAERIHAWYYGRT
ncbi:MAG: glycosyltransferase [Verrucomicrobiales bacterium]